MGSRQHLSGYRRFEEPVYTVVETYCRLRDSGALATVATTNMAAGPDDVFQ
jgi:hypothetical protein